ncbi:MAG: hypothetical protein ACLSB9_33815 [Hydrogeniiclostridium mannosilyticum]
MRRLAADGLRQTGKKLCANSESYTLWENALYDGKSMAPSSRARSSCSVSATCMEICASGCCFDGAPIPATSRIRHGDVAPSAARAVLRQSVRFACGIYRMVRAAWHSMRPAWVAPVLP